MKQVIEKYFKKLMAGLLTGAMVVTLMPAAAKVSGNVKAAENVQDANDINGANDVNDTCENGDEGLKTMSTGVLSEAGDYNREKINFNREWKFIRKDIDNAKDSDYDDSNWFNVGLPHDFSIPYYQETRHFTGYGWYRKSFEYDSSWNGKSVNLEFDGVFHTAEVYVNDVHVGDHEGGYTGFTLDITDYLKEGQNLIAVRVNNVWKEDMAPRTGEHNFTGGIYRDVNLVVTSPVHVTWNGTFAQTPDISKESSKLLMEAEVINDSTAAWSVKVVHTLVDKEGQKVTQFGSADVSIGAGETNNFSDVSADIVNPHLWSPNAPYMYKVVTDVYVGNVQTDSYETQIGFRWTEWTSDQGFFLNGEHLWINGANVHQDHAGWANAVTKEGAKRDIAMVKEAGLNFIRGSHYPHSPNFVDNCDEQGLMFWSECDFWGTYAFDEGGAYGDSEDYKADGYPTTGDKEVEARFEQSCLTQLEEMIRIHRNHPSVIVWSMGNEVFFGANNEKKKALISRMGKLAKELDPTRATAMGGTQVGGFDKIPNIDVAGYNGDGGGTEYHNPGVANMASEYSNHTGNRPDKFTAYYNNLELEDNGDPMQYPWRSGVSLWCAFHHGSIMSRGYGDMGFIDYYRLPLQTWYYYRWKNTGVDAEESTEGKAAKLSLEASDLQIPNDGTKDTHITVTVQDEDGNWVNAEPEMVFEVVKGPGVFPNGKTQKFTPGDSMRDGKAAIEFRSYYVGDTVIKAYSPSDPELGEASITITTTGNSTSKEPDITKMYGSFMSNGGMVENSVEEPSLIKYHNYNGSQTWASSGESTRRNMQDGNIDTEWVADAPGDQWVYFEQEHGGINLYKVQVIFKGKAYPYRIQYKSNNLDEPEWKNMKEYDQNALADRPVEDNVGGVYMRYFRVEFTGVPADEYVRLAEVKLYGIRAKTDAYKVGILDMSEVRASNEDSSLNYDLSKDAPGYTRFQCRASLNSSDSQKDTLVQVYCDDELMYEKHLLSADDSADIDISVNNVKKLKLVSMQDNANVMAVNWTNARLLGAIRDISNSNSMLKFQIIENSGTLVPGKDYETELRIINGTEQKANLAIALALYSKDGTLTGSSMQLIDVESNQEANAVNGISVPGDIGNGAYVKVYVWDQNTLLPAAEIVTTTRDAAAPAGMGSPADNRDTAQLCGVLRQVLEIVGAGDAEKYTLDSRKGISAAMFGAVSALNDIGQPQAQVNTTVGTLSAALAGLTLVPQGGSNNPSTGGNGSGTGVTPNPGGNAAVTSGTGKANAGKSGDGKDSGDTDKLKKGSAVKAGALKYKVLSVKKGKAAAAVYRCVNKKAKSITIPATIKLKGVKCKVTKIAAKAFAGMKKLGTVNIGGNIKAVGSKAFNKCTALKKVVIKKAVLKKIGKKAFSGAGKKLRFSQA